jgi:hypothetical protein
LHFATFAGSDVEVFGLITEHEQAKREMGKWVGRGQGAQIAGDWWTECGICVIDVGEPAVVRIVD